MTWFSAFTDAGGLAKAASRMATCGVESVLLSIAGARSLSYKVRAHVLAPDLSLDLEAHTWTSVVGNELADAFAEMGGPSP